MSLIFKEYLALISNLRYIPKDYGIIEETLVFFILRLTLFRPKGEEEVREWYMYKSLHNKSFLEEQIKRISLKDLKTNLSASMTRTLFWIRWGCRSIRMRVFRVERHERLSLDIVRRKVAAGGGVQPSCLFLYGLFPIEFFILTIYAVSSPFQFINIEMPLKKSPYNVNKRMILSKTKTLKEKYPKLSISILS